jgi:hypothetical protein
MFTSSQTFNTYNELERKTPVYIVQIDGTQYNAQDVYFASGSFADIDATFFQLLEDDGSGMFADADPLETRNTIGDMSFSLVLDSAGVVQDVVRNYFMDGRKVKVWYGYEELNFAEFTRLPDFFIKERAMDSDLMVMSFACQGGLYKIYGDVFRVIPETSLARTFIRGEITLALEDGSSFNGNGGSSSFDYEPQGYQPVLIHGGSNYIGYEGITLDQGEFGDDVVQSPLYNGTIPPSNPLYAVTLAGVNDSALALSSTLSTTFEAADAYIQRGTTFTQKWASHDNFVMGIELVPPGSATTSSRTVKVVCSALSGGSIQSQAEGNLSYTPSDTATLNFSVKILPGDPQYPDFLKADWTETSATLADRPTLRLTGMRAYSGGTIIDAGTDVHQGYIMHQRNPGELFVRYLVTTDDGNNGIYDLGIAGYGLGIPEDQVNVREILQKCGKYYGIRNGTWSLAFRQVLSQTEATPEFFHRTVLQAMAPCFPYIDELGLINLHIPDILDLPAGPLTAITLSDDTIIGKPGVGLVDQELMNNIRTTRTAFRDIGYNEFEIQSVPSVNTLGETVQKSFDLRGLQSVIVQNDQVKYFYRRMLMLYSNPGMDLHAETWYKKALVYTGDTVAVSHSDIPNHDVGGRGIATKRCFVWSAEFDFLEHPTFGLRTFEYHKLGTAYQESIDNVTLVDITDSALALSPTLGVATLPSDAYYHMQTLAAAASHYQKYTIRMTPPGTATDANKYARLQVGIASAATLEAKHLLDIPFNPALTGVEDWEFIVHAQTLQNGSYAKVDWYETDATLADRPTLQFRGLGLYRTGINLSLKSTTGFF